MARPSNQQSRLQHILARLKEGNMLDHPGLRWQVQRALATGDRQALEDFLNRNPALLALAKRNRLISEHQRSLNPFRPYPTRQEVAEFLDGPLKMGFVNEHHQDLFGLWPDDLCKILINIGRVGSGKSVILRQLILQVMALARRSFNLILFDPQKREYRNLITTCPSLKIIPRGLLKLNPLQLHPFLSLREHIIMHTDILVSEAYLGGVSRNELIAIQHELYQLYQNPNLYQLLSQVRMRRRQGQKSYRMHEIYLNIENRLQAILESGVFDCQQGITTDIFQEQDLVIELDGLQDMVANYIIAFITRSLYLKNIKQGLIDASLRHLILIEEARTLLQAQRDISTFGESAFNQDLTRIRAAGIGTVITTQEPRSISPTVRSLAFTKIAFPLNDGADLDFVQKGWGLSNEQKKYIFEMPSHGQAIVRYGSFKKPFLIAVPYANPPETPEKSQFTNLMRDFWDSIKTCTIPLNDDIEIQKAQTCAHMPPAAAALLYHLGAEPFTPLMGLYRLQGFTPARVRNTLQWLRENNFLDMRKYPLGGTRPATFLLLKKNALQYLGITQIPGKGGFQHKLYQFIVYQWLIKNGFSATIEASLPRQHKTIDVLAQHPQQGFIAYEITLHMQNLIQNILEDLLQGVAKVVIVTPGKTDQKQAQKIVTENRQLNTYKEKISFQNISAFITRDDKFFLT
ncbi:ATP-binding protein [Desulfovulcanus sp.]